MVSRQDQVYQDHWLPMQELLGDSGLVDFVRYQLMTTGQFVRESDVYQEWKKRLEKFDPSELIQELREFSLDAMLYHRIVAPATEPEAGISDRLIRINRWGGQTIYPFLLFVYRKYMRNEFPPASFVEILAMLESFLVRRLFANAPTTTLNRLFFRLAHQLPPDVDFVEGIRLALSQPGRRWPTDDEFAAAIQVYPLYTDSRGEQRRLILESIESSYGHKEPADLAPLTVEHIMPQTLTSSWVDALGSGAEAIHDRLLHVLGNLTLTGYNPDMSNRPFAD